MELFCKDFFLEQIQLLEWIRRIKWQGAQKFAFVQSL